MTEDERRRLRFAAFRWMVAAGICAIFALQLWPGRHVIGGWLFYTILSLVSLLTVCFFTGGMMIIRKLKDTPPE